MSIVDVKDLIDIPGAGRAEVALRAIGAWDDERAPGAVKWIVTVYASVPAAQQVTVRAATREEAEKLGQARAVERGNWEVETWLADVETVLAAEVEG